MTVQIEKKSLDDINGTDKTKVRPSTSFVCFCFFYFLCFFLVRCFFGELYMEASCSPLIENHSVWRFGFKLKIAAAIAKHREARAVKSLHHHVRVAVGLPRISPYAGTHFAKSM